MACSDCFPGNSVVINSGTGIVVSGSGTPGDPYVITANATPDGDWAYAETIAAAPDLNLLALERPAVVEVTLSGTGTLSLPNGWGSNRSGTIRLILTQDGTGGRTLNFASVAESAAPIVLSTAGNATDVVDLTWTGMRWVAVMVAKGIS